jgi:hypothetical protein
MTGPDAYREALHHLRKADDAHRTGFTGEADHFAARAKAYAMLALAAAIADATATDCLRDPNPRAADAKVRAWIEATS